ncbi:hypothetical protein GIW78_25680 [Pseudomonas syringae]|nr:hypothetical protein [Pseudomonas syringae]
MGNPCNEILGNHSKGLPWVFTQSGPGAASLASCQATPGSAPELSRH